MVDNAGSLVNGRYTSTQVRRVRRQPSDTRHSWHMVDKAGSLVYGRYTSTQVRSVRRQPSDTRHSWRMVDNAGCLVNGRYTSTQVRSVRRQPSDTRHSWHMVDKAGSMVNGRYTSTQVRSVHNEDWPDIPVSHLIWRNILLTIAFMSSSRSTSGFKYQWMQLALKGQITLPHSSKHSNGNIEHNLTGSYYPDIHYYLDICHTVKAVNNTKSFKLIIQLQGRVIGEWCAIYTTLGGDHIYNTGWGLHIPHIQHWVETMYTYTTLDGDYIYHI